MPSSLFYFLVVVFCFCFRYIVSNVSQFPPDTVKQELLQPSNHSTYCSWKGIAIYNNVIADGQTIENAVWHYHSCFDKAKHIEKFYAFCISYLPSRRILVFLLTLS